MSWCHPAMDQEPPDEWSLSVTVKTEPEWFDGESGEHGNVGEQLVKIKEEPLEGLMGLIVTNALPSVIPSNLDESPASFKDLKRHRNGRIIRNPCNYRKGKLYELDQEYDDGSIEALLKECEEQLSPKKKKETKMYSCLVCNFETPERKRLIHHKIAIHGEQKHACLLCDFRTGYMTDLAKHQKHCLGGNKFYCNKCSFKANTPERLARHETVHATEFLCDRCTYKAKHKQTLKRHQLKKH